MAESQMSSQRCRRSRTTARDVLEFAFANVALDQSSGSTAHEMLPDIRSQRLSRGGNKLRGVTLKLVFVIRVFVVHVFVVYNDARLQYICIHLSM